MQGGCRAFLTQRVIPLPEEADEELLAGEQDEHADEEAATDADDGVLELLDARGAQHGGQTVKGVAEVQFLPLGRGQLRVLVGLLALLPHGAPLRALLRGTNPPPGK
eukprot:1414939-Pyramimonas_sp.AAC.2